MTKEKKRVVANWRIILTTLCSGEAPYNYNFFAKNGAHYLQNLWKQPIEWYLTTYRISGNFREFRELQAIRENIICECLVFVDKDRAIALIRENIIHEMLYLAHSQKFSPAKISRYTVIIEHI